ncbi:UDP-N-acetylmuramate dehydrogenase [Tuwongella immobilis]|uniref:UDP-N-acetylenolpyruvoylglucosamine reductase n=1 Tax=Tuwongella immobilis TaxID=692036 RepID=A0A6C2YH67_9BACT|nr:UDP-N-acetylmuramate dehydrogenase [Tuwongella immobilis]VIP00868.1 udp-n-acetylenolpyruvoylglucosamine reductase : UDP-N-acetylenolpyruvoylglucosamine reductase OS=Planctomyces limnophilus (strain ATCC 43296 / DSM 3776 / IFAM 1008 / 290) GN=murB PE=3 SV=1: FAD_binding_4: MurB_C [Tuwongella immobilis]VTR97154.1 udp-n-acetylenolpyruvoylglucosamine reductase : UDP-N-acetylenolpyruvoylglucosamine reductase OS=Planctomyces limnophilus (strain ATCC 43296 / DSM 3776 / IFAM 1008 / 290) GN=murB PE=3 S
MAFQDEFPEITRVNESLAPYTYLRIGGPADFLVQPRTREELAAVVRSVFTQKLPFRVLGNGCNLVIADEGVRGVVVRLNEPAFCAIHVEQRRMTVGGGAQLSTAISAAARHNLAGFETLVGIHGTLGGALQCNAGDRTGAIGNYVRRVEVLDRNGQVQVRERDEMHFSEHTSDLDDPVILSIEFELESDSAEQVVKRMRKAWITRQAGQPLSFESAIRTFKNPRGHSAATLIEQAGLVGMRVGGAVVSDRNANYIVAQPNTSARDLTRLIDLVQSKVREKSGVTLEREVRIW